jgi:hypothetical protein
VVPSGSVISLKYSPYLNEFKLPESIEWKSEIRISKLETSLNIKMIKIQNFFNTFENLNFELVSDFGCRASNFARRISLGNFQRDLLFCDNYRTEHEVGFHSRPAVSHPEEDT